MSTWALTGVDFGVDWCQPRCRLRYRHGYRLVLTWIGTGIDLGVNWS